MNDPRVDDRLAQPIVSHRNNPVASGVASFGMAALCLWVNRAWTHTSTVTRVLLAFAVMFLVIGIVTLLWRPQRVTRVDRAARRLRLVDRTGFGERVRVVTFDTIAEVELRQHHQADLDARPVKILTWSVALRLVDGSRVSLTDWSLDREAEQRLQTALARAVAGQDAF